ncbi:hypothetical protein VU07_01925 [Desulfobulbus sp. F4]|nr:hypothetical protein [Desulfobulbus sp. F4]
MTAMKCCAAVLAMLLALPGAALAEGKYSRDTLCKEKGQEIAPHDCNLRVEQAVAKDIPGVIERKGPVLRLHTKRGKVLERKNSGPKVKESLSWVLWACDWLPESGFVEICYGFYESSKSEFIHLKTGKAVELDGWPIYSPSRRRVLMADGYAEEMDSLEIWRFEEQGMVREFRVKSPPGKGWEQPVWNSESEIEAKPSPDEQESGLLHRLVQGKSGWVLRPAQ